MPCPLLANQWRGRESPGAVKQHRCAPGPSRAAAPLATPPPQGLAGDLMGRAFTPTSMPHHQREPRCRSYYHFTPEQEALSLPSDVARTHLKLLVNYDGWYVLVRSCVWAAEGAVPCPRARVLMSGAACSICREFVVFERSLRSQTSPEADCGPLLVTVVEFESTALVIGHLGIRVSLVSYPCVSVEKVFLDDVQHRLRTDPAGFTGLLTSC
jgi:hypothetical protein